MKTLYRFLIVMIVGSIFCPGNSIAQSIPLKSIESYYAIEINGVLCGYNHELIKSINRDGNLQIEITSDVLLLQSVLGGSADITVNSKKLVDPSTGDFIRLETELSQGGITMGSLMEVEGDIVNFVNKATGEEKQIEIDNLLLDNGSFYTSILGDINDNNLKENYKTIDPRDGMFDSRFIELLSREQISLNGMNYKTIKLSELYSKSGASSEVWIDEETGYVLKRNFNNGRSIYLADKSILENIETANLNDDLFAKVGKKIEDISSISYMKVKAKIRSSGEWITVDSLNTKGQEFEGTVENNLIDGTFEITHQRYDGTGSPTFPIDYSSYADLVKYIGPEEFIESDDEVIIEKAKEITRGASDSWDAATRITSWVASNTAYAIPGGVTARKTLDIGNGECGAHSRLVAALCRSVGIPSKFVIGCMYTHNFGGSFGQHAWNEIYMGEAGWIPVDATARENTYIDCGHIRLGEKTSFNPVEMEIIEYTLADDNTVEIDVPEKYRKFIGNYIGPNSGQIFEVSCIESGLQVNIPGSIKVQLKDPDDKGMWYTTISDQLYFSFEDDGTDLSPYMHLYQLTPAPKTSEADSIPDDVPEKLRPYLGKYYFAAITNNITVVYQDTSLAVKDPTYEGLIRLYPPDENGIWMDQFYQNGLKFIFNEEGKVTQLNVLGEFVLERER